jgi:hypothetical protein
MAHDPILSVYTIKLSPIKSKKVCVENSNRFLFKNKIGQPNEDNLTDSFVITELFAKFIQALDTNEMYTDSVSQKCMTANQLNIEDENVNANIVLHSDHCIIEGRVEGGTFGRKRNKTSTIDKTIKSEVNEGDAITEDFYFLLYSPLQSNKSTLFLQSYSDDSIDNVMKKFWKNFFSVPALFNQPSINRFFPASIIEDFKTDATVSSLTFTTDVPGETLLANTRNEMPHNYRVTVKITPIDSELTYDEFDNAIEPIKNTLFTRLLHLGQFTKKKGTLKDSSTNKTSEFDLASSFEIKPSILLSKYITIEQNESDFERIKDYCFSLLESIKPEIYIEYAVQER